MNQESLKGHEGHRERLRKHYLTFANQMSEQELLELLLTFSIPRKDVSPIAEDLLKHYKSIAAIISAPYEELASFPGIGESSAVLLKIINTVKMKNTVNQQPPLFTTKDIEQDTVVLPRNMRIFTNDEITNSLSLLPKAPSFSCLDKYKLFLVENLPYNSGETRRRRADYILDRFYPSDSIDTPLTFYLSQALQGDALKPVIFYHVLKSEPIAIKVAEELIYPLLPVGRTNRDQLKDFVLKYFPEASDSSLNNMLRAFFNLYGLLDMGYASGENLRFQLRQGKFEPFLYIFTSEFFQPGIYSFDQLYQGPLHRWMLWDREWIRRQLYNLRDLEILSKISEIDTVKQFTVALDQLASLQKYFQTLKEKPLFLREKANDLSEVIKSPVE